MAIAVVAALLLLLAPAARAGLNIPYVVDANTLHLWHFGETNGTGVAYDAVSNNVQTAQMNMLVANGQDNPPTGTPTEFVQQGQPGPIAALSSILTTQYACLLMPFTIITNANGTTNNTVNSNYTSAGVIPSALFTNMANYVNTNTGAFTFEAILEPAISPVSPNFPVAGQFFSGDSDYTNSSVFNRSWQFRINTSGQLEYIDIFNDGVSPDFDAVAALPSGINPDAAKAGSWYHVAATFTGTHPTNGDPANVFTLYWTALAEGIPTYAHVLQTFTKTNIQAGVTTLAIGGSFRGNFFNNVASGNGFPGYIAEVRVSDVCRHSNEMAFNTNAADIVPTVLSQPPATILQPYGQTLIISPTIVGTAPITNTWTQNGTVIYVGTNSSLVISNATFAANGTYVCHATNHTATYGTKGTNTTACVVTVGAAFDGLFSSGVDTNGNALDASAPGSVDPHWQLIQSADPNASVPNAIVWSTGSPVSPNGGSAGDGANYAWIGAEENIQTGVGAYDYHTTFLIDQTSLTNAVLTANVWCGGVAAGSAFVVTVNGVQTSYNNSGNPPAIATPIIVTTANGLQYGSNTLDITSTTGDLAVMVQIITNIGNPYPAGLPMITNQPASDTVEYGTSATFAVVALAQPPLSYQWYFDGSALNPSLYPGATSRVLTLSAANGDAPTLASQGNYMVVVSNSSGSVTSSVASLTLTLASEPVNNTNVMTVYAGASPAFSVLPDTGGFAYQWYSNNVALSAATNANYTITNIALGAWGSLDCIILQMNGSTTSTVWNVTAIAAPTASYPTAIMGDAPMGFWRLNDSGGSDLAIDSWGGNDGIYTNAVQDNVPTQDSAYDPTEGSAGFGLTAFANSDVYGINGVNFATPTNNSAAFSVEAWVNSYEAQTLNAGIVNLGYQFAEQFTVDCGGTSSAFRFFVRDAGGNPHDATSTVVPVNGQWYHLVGVCDETHGTLKLYIDGQLAATSTVPVGGGLLSTSNTVTFGSRMSGATTANNLQFVGYMDDVSIYDYALSYTQVTNHYYAADIGPTIISITPTNETADQNGTATFTATVSLATPPVSYQWYDNNTTLPISGATSNILVLTDVQADDSYYLIVTNLYGTNQSGIVNLAVVSNTTVAVDVLPQYYVPIGGSVSIAVTAYGAVPLAYQWQVSDTNEVTWTNLVNGSRISGAQSNVLTIVNASLTNAGEYQLLISGPGGAANSSVANVIVGGLPIVFHGARAGWSSNQTGGYSTPIINGNVLTLTDGAGSEARASFFDYPQYIGAFKAAFTYQGVTNGADGIAFVLQNDPRGPAALGAPGGDLGVNGITPSFELEFNIYGGTTDLVGYGVFTNGNHGTNIAPGSVSLNSGDPIGVSVAYLNGQMALTFTDAVAATSFSTNLAVGNLTTVVGGSTAYVGFTGSDGGSVSTQTISNFTFVSIPTETIEFNGTDVVVSWPSVMTGYALQQNTNLATTNWVNVTNATTVVNGQNQVAVPPGSGAAFYRLFLP